MPRKTIFQDKKTQNIFDNLVSQIDRIKHRNNEKGFSTQARYYAAAQRFCGYLAEDFRCQKFANVSGKHLKAYIEKLQSEGKSTQYIDTELSGIRFYHERSGSKNRLPENKALNLEKRHPKRFDRSFLREEIKGAYNCADAMGRTDVNAGMRLCYRFGLRLEEAVTLRVEQIEHAVKYGQLEIKNGKGGQARTIPVETKAQRNALLSLCEYAKEQRKQLTDYLLCDNRKHSVKKCKESLENWMSNHRSKFLVQNRTVITEPGKKPRIASPGWHGFRHSYYQVTKTRLIRENRMSISEIEREMSERLCHHRNEVNGYYDCNLPQK